MSPTGEDATVPIGGPIAHETAGLPSYLTELAERLAPGVQLLHRLGAGGMGVVFLGRDAVLRRSVAIKVLAPELSENSGARTRFMREAQAAAAVTHPNVVSVYHVDTLPRSGMPYYLMQFIEGQSLGERLTEGRALGESTARRVIGEVAAALAAAHSRGLVHRDIKPNNIMLDRESGRALVVDFGISAAVNARVFGDASALTEQGAYIGTPLYTSPEQAAGQTISHPSDVYSLGVVAFQLLTGRLPFEASSTIEMLAAHLKDAPPRVAALRPDIDRRFAELIDRCLAKEPATRPTAAEIASYLVPSPQHAIEWPPPGLEWLRGSGARVATALGYAVGFAILFMLLLSATPTRSSVAWYGPEQSEFWTWVQQRVVWFQSARAPIDLTRSEAVGDATPIWLFSLALVAVLVVVSGMMAITRTIVFARALMYGRRAGYPATTLFDVGWDYRGDTAALLNGAGDFALVSPDERSRLLALRQIQRSVVIATLVITVLAAALWLAGVVRIRQVNEPILIVSGETSKFLLLVLLGALAIVATSAREARLRAAGRGWRDLLGATRRLLPRSEVVAAWLRATSARAPGKSWAPLLVAGLVPVLLAVALLSVVATVFLITVSTAERTNKARSSAERWLAGTRNDTREASPPPSADARRLAPSGSSGGRWLALMADPDSPPGLAIIADSTTSSRDRIELVYAIVPAFCLNPREVALGVDARRRNLLQKAATSLGGKDEGALAFTTDWLERWIHSPRQEAAPYARKLPLLLNALGWIGLPDIRARLAFCRAYT